MGECAQVIPKHYTISYKGLEHHKFWYQGRSRNQSYEDTKGWLYLLSPSNTCTLQTSSAYILGIIIFIFCFLGLHPRHMEVPRLGAQLGATAASQHHSHSHVCDLHHSSQQHWSLNLLREARDRTHILMGTSRIHVCRASTGTPQRELPHNF